LFSVSDVVIYDGFGHFRFWPQKDFAFFGFLFAAELELKHQNSL